MDEVEVLRSENDRQSNTILQLKHNVDILSSSDVNIGQMVDKLAELNVLQEQISKKDQFIKELKLERIMLKTENNDLVQQNNELIEEVDENLTLKYQVDSLNIKVEELEDNQKKKKKKSYRKSTEISNTHTHREHIRKRSRSEHAGMKRRKSLLNIKTFKKSGTPRIEETSIPEDVFHTGTDIEFDEDGERQKLVDCNNEQLMDQVISFKKNVLKLMDKLNTERRLWVQEKENLQQFQFKNKPNKKSKQVVEDLKKQTKY
eukprot:TRINITY_DN665_c0_g1_i10.p1 TRINITY_DN665_c0_g1~~TRINITY_DN665_c0_g1_i10.p1  ORF type:complete len:260 (+),score=77.86 TRINITY_DN665_c0_g1_i10:467-1246(+)